MNNHFATRSLDENGDWKDLTNQYNSSSDIQQDPKCGFWDLPHLKHIGIFQK